MYIDLQFNFIEHFRFTACDEEFLNLKENVYESNQYKIVIL